MDVFNFCWMTLLDESKKCCVFFNKNTCDVRNNVDENFNKPVKRIFYLYKFGSYNISFFHQCFKEFYMKVPDSSKIIDNLRAIKNLTICSMSAGPGTDIIGLLYSLNLINKPLVNSAVFKVISRHSSWSNVVNEMINSSIISVPDASTLNFTARNFLKDLSKKSQNYLKAANILLMCDSLSSSLTPEKMISQALERVIQLLKPGALVFLIFSKEKSDYFKELDRFGSFLYGPVKVTLENMPYNENIAELVGVKPVCSGSSMFAVWRKLREIDFQKEAENNLVVGSNQHSSTKLINSKSDVKDINSPILSMSSLEREFSSDSIASSSQFSSSSISSQIIKLKDKPVSDNSVNFNVQNIEFPEIHFKTSAKNASSVSLNASDSLVGKYASSCEIGQKKIENKGNGMNSLLKNLESLIKV